MHVVMCTSISAWKMRVSCMALKETPLLKGVSNRQNPYFCSTIWNNWGPGCYINKSCISFNVCNNNLLYFWFWSDKYPFVFNWRQSWVWDAQYRMKKLGNLWRTFSWLLETVLILPLSVLTEFKKDSERTFVAYFSSNDVRIKLNGT